MNFEQKKEAFVKPALSTMMTPLEFSSKLLPDFIYSTGASSLIDFIVDNIKEN